MSLSTEQKSVITFLHKEGHSYREIANKVGCSVKGIYTTIKRFQETGSQNHRARSGRPRISTERADRSLVRISLSDRKLTSAHLRREWKESTGVEAARSTVRQRLLDSGLRGCKARKKPFVNEQQRRRRLAWAKAHQNWSIEEWQRVLFSDESTFTLNSHAGNNYVRRRVGEEFKPCCILPTVKHPASVMVWGCMTASGVGRLHLVQGMMNAKQYIEVLEKKMKPSSVTLFGEDEEYIFQDDNAPCHRAKVVKEWLRANNVTTLDWPAQSPDLNPIENLWQRLNNLISVSKPKTKTELIEKIINNWHHIITTEELRKLVESMPRRCKMVIENKGYPIKY